MSRRMLCVIATLLLQPAVTHSSPWSMLALPWVFGQPLDQESTSGTSFPEIARSERPLLEPMVLRSSQEESETVGADTLSRECLKAWREVWRQQRYDLALILARKAVSYDPRSVDAQHALAVSEIVAAVAKSAPDPFRAGGCGRCGTFDEIPDLFTPGARGAREPSEWLRPYRERTVTP